MARKLDPGKIWGLGKWGGGPVARSGFMIWGHLGSLLFGAHFGPIFYLFGAHWAHLGPILFGALFWPSLLSLFGGAIGRSCKGEQLAHACV